MIDKTKWKKKEMKNLLISSFELSESKIEGPNRHLVYPYKNIQGEVIFFQTLLCISYYDIGRKVPGGNV